MCTHEYIVCFRNPSNGNVHSLKYSTFKDAEATFLKAVERCLLVACYVEYSGNCRDFIPEYIMYTHAYIKFENEFCSIYSGKELTP